MWHFLKKSASHIVFPNGFFVWTLWLMVLLWIKYFFSILSPCELLIVLMRQRIPITAKCLQNQDCFWLSQYLGSGLMISFTYNWKVLCENNNLLLSLDSVFQFLTAMRFKRCFMSLFLPGSWNNIICEFSLIQELRYCSEERLHNY